MVSGHYTCLKTNVTQAFFLFGKSKVYRKGTNPQATNLHHQARRLSYFPQLSSQKMWLFYRSIQTFFIWHEVKGQHVLFVCEHWGKKEQKKQRTQYVKHITEDTSTCRIAKCPEKVVWWTGAPLFKGVLIFRIKQSTGNCHVAWQTDMKKNVLFYHYGKKTCVAGIV